MRKEKVESKRIEKLREYINVLPTNIYHSIEEYKIEITD